MSFDLLLGDYNEVLTNLYLPPFVPAAMYKFYGSFIGLFFKFSIRLLDILIYQLFYHLIYHSLYKTRRPTKMR